MKKLLSTVSAAAFMAVAISQPAFADSASDVAQLQKQVELLQQQVERLSSLVEKQSGKIAEQEKSISKVASSSAATKIDNVKISMAPSPKISSTDGRYEFQPFGRVHLDYAFFDDDKKDHGDNANFRRARLGFKGKVDEDWKYTFEMDFAKEDVAFKDISVKYTGLDFADFQVGHFKPYFGMDENQSSNYIQFLERASVSNAFARDEEIGAGFRSGHDNWSVAAGVWNEDGGTDSSATDDEAWTIDGRATFAPLNEKGRVVHLGAGGSYRVPNAGSDNVTFSSKVTGVGANLITTSAITNVDSSQIYNLEAAGAFDSFAAQAEYYIVDVNKQTGIDPSFGGWYAQASYLLTGETRPYDAKIGNFKRIKPSNPFSLKTGGTGAWELLGRVSNVDLNDQGAGVTGGELDDWTLGVNWYVNNNTRFMFNYINADTDNNAVVADDDPQVFTIRAQVDF